MKHTIYLLFFLLTAGIAQAVPYNTAPLGATTHLSQEWLKAKVGRLLLQPRQVDEVTDSSADSSQLAPFLSTTWEFTIPYYDDEEDSPVSVFAFNSSITTSEDGAAALVAIDDTGGPWVLWYEDSESSYILAADTGEGDVAEYSFNCDTPGCDTTVIGYFRVLYSDDTSSEPLPFIGQRFMEEEETEPTPTCDLLPSLGSTYAIDASGNSGSNETVFCGGISVNSGAYQVQMTQSLNDPVDVKGEMTVDPIDVGETADIFVYAETTLPDSAEVYYFMLDEGLRAILLWDQNSASLAAFQPGVRLNAVETVSMYQGNFLYPGTLKVYFGYRLMNGTVVMNEIPIDITIN